MDRTDPRGVGRPNGEKVEKNIAGADRQTESNPERVMALYARLSSPFCRFTDTYNGFTDFAFSGQDGLTVL